MLWACSDYSVRQAREIADLRQKVDELTNDFDDRLVD
jgi:hypothetical protein